MLIVLDNFEQLLDAGQFVGELIAAAPGLRLLITSRVALNWHDEWLHPIEGLSFPTTDDDTPTVVQLARYDAVRLFEQHARRMRSDFSLSRERVPVVRLCRLVEGMPLALELAASWLKLLSVEQVVAALERGLDILTARNSDIPARHRSMRAVLEESWELLSGEEQRALAGLAVFPPASAPMQPQPWWAPGWICWRASWRKRCCGAGRMAVSNCTSCSGSSPLKSLPPTYARRGVGRSSSAILRHLTAICTAISFTSICAAMCSKAGDVPPR
ncbi:MAG TPA: hypothetical protein VFU22_31970 [Roseiflexaceae bacterium]|nr:hypothetical protein [Roseiflexaceae bacterium]